MDISKLHPEDTAAIDELWEMWRLGVERDTASPKLRTYSKTIFLAQLGNIHPDEHNEFRVARVDGRIVGFVQIGVPLRDNKHAAHIHGTVHPEYRRRGIGTALLTQATQSSRDQGRTLQTSNTLETLPDGPLCDHAGRDFLLHHGFAVGLPMRLRALRLSDSEGEIERELLDESWPKAEGYELVQWTGATPAEHVDGAAALASRLMSDVPQGDLDFEEVIFDAERYLRKESVDFQSGWDFTCTYVRHVESGELVAHSVIAVSSDHPSVGNQWITLVHPDHRGHRLGMIVKVENHRLLRRTKPEVTWIKTGNAESNEHMVAINEQLGFTELCRYIAFQREI
ncbi:GNAT family N-acetyltransferase [Stackebrandtia nassauensis]|uniref:GCN5-related N-acetyltransferase n=1 Tax=Stackebrandtia nassauensis (strain DSM 44728 / CIP 108903 / NRRL B-16338 / NBRC 102104 / LLR-40K-21) TaxID=446470 RepID=D3Q1F3_STANL|nr:GNAT family N-acetyltransferase [Stackebrandtia nassauensis]ADD45733.1 GCN5-related N-acetyltransferase [Stackebrandtia nassauensis DSM 44728]